MFASSVLNLSSRQGCQVNYPSGHLHMSATPHTHITAVDRVARSIRPQDICTCQPHPLTHTSLQGCQPGYTYSHCVHSLIHHPAPPVSTPHNTHPYTKHPCYILVINIQSIYNLLQTFYTTGEEYI